MSWLGKGLLVLGLGGLAGIGLALWGAFGGTVYAAALAGAWGACF